MTDGGRVETVLGTVWDEKMDTYQYDELQLWNTRNSKFPDFY